MPGKAENSSIMTFPKSKKAPDNQVVCFQIQAEKKSLEFLIDGS